MILEVIAITSKKKKRRRNMKREEKTETQRRLNDIVTVLGSTSDALHGQRRKLWGLHAPCHCVTRNDSWVREPYGES